MGRQYGLDPAAAAAVAVAAAAVQVKSTGRSLGVWLRDHGLEVLSQATRTRRARMAARSATHATHTITDIGAAMAGTAATAAAAAAAGFVLPAAVASRTHSRSYSALDQQQQQQQQQQMQWQWSAQQTSEAPPSSNNLAGMTSPHTQPQLTAAQAAEAEAAAAAAAAAVQLVMAGAVSGQSGASESAQGYAAGGGDRLVGSRVETWSHLDRTWFPAAVEVRAEQALSQHAKYLVSLEWSVPSSCKSIPFWHPAALNQTEALLK
jgi:hypothetical protein